MKYKDYISTVKSQLNKAKKKEQSAKSKSKNAIQFSHQKCS